MGYSETRKVSGNLIVVLHIVFDTGFFITVSEQHTSLITPRQIYLQTQKLIQILLQYTQEQIPGLTMPSALCQAGMKVVVPTYVRETFLLLNFSIR
jgi:hypothetical protein